MDKRVVFTFLITIVIASTLLVFKSCKKECIPPMVLINDSVVEVGSEITMSCTSESDDLVTWNFGDNNTATGTLVKHEYSSPGTYIIVASQDKGCISSKYNIKVLPRPEPIKPIKINLNIIVPENISAEESVSFATDSPLSEYEWTVVETNQKSTESSISVSFTKAGNFQLKLSGKSDKFFGDTTIILKVGPKKMGPVNIPATLQIVGPKTGTAGNPISFICTTPYLTQYVWSIKETGQTFNSKSFKIVFEKPGPYTIILNASGNAGGKPFSLTKTSIIAIAAGRKVEEPCPPNCTCKLSDPEFSEAFTQLANKLHSDESASDEWQKTMGSCACSNNIFNVALFEDQSLIENRNSNKFRRDMVLNNYEVIKVLKIQRGAKNCILSVNVQVKKTQ